VAVSKRLNTVGLLVGTVGVVLLFIWAPQPSFERPSFDRGASVSLEDNTTLPLGKTVAQKNAEIAAREVHYNRMSKIGLGLIGLGFALQFMEWIVRRSFVPPAP
jgi:hypothetical protein